MYIEQGQMPRLQPQQSHGLSSVLPGTGPATNTVLGYGANTLLGNGANTV